MRKLTTICLSLISILLLGSIVAEKSYATLSCKVGLQAPQSTYTKEDEFSVTVSISNLQAGKGIVALGAVLDYDKTALDLKEVEGENKWSAQISESKSKIVAYSGKKVTQDEAVMKLTFVVKKDTTAKSTWVKVHNFEISDGNEEITAEPVTLTLSIQDKQVTPPKGDSENGNQSGSNATTSNNNKTKESRWQGRLPNNAKGYNCQQNQQRQSHQVCGSAGFGNGICGLVKPRRPSLLPIDRVTGVI